MCLTPGPQLMMAVGPLGGEAKLEDVDACGAGLEWL